MCEDAGSSENGSYAAMDSSVRLVAEVSRAPSLEATSMSDQSAVMSGTGYIELLSESSAKGNHAGSSFTPLALIRRSFGPCAFGQPGASAFSSTYGNVAVRWRGLNRNGATVYSQWFKRHCPNLTCTFAGYFDPASGFRLNGFIMDANGPVIHWAECSGAA